MSLSTITVNITEKLNAQVNVITAPLAKPYVDVRDYSSFAAAVTAIGSAECTLLIPNGQAVSGNVSVPSNISLKFFKGGSLSIADGVTVTINGDLDAGLYQIFSWTGTGKVVFGSGSIKKVHVKWWGAKIDDSTDDTVAVNAAANAALSIAFGAIVSFTAGTCKVTHLNLSNASDLNRYTSPSIKLVGAGIKSTRLEGTLNGAILIDCIGRDFVQIEDMEIGTDGTAVYQCAILLARRTGGGYECAYNKFARLYINGEYSIATVVSIGSETNSWEDVILENDDPTNNYCTFFTGDDNGVAAVTSTHGTILAGPNTNNKMSGVWMAAEHNNGTIAIFDTIAEYTFIKCGVFGNGTGIKFATYIAGGGGGVFNGRVNWYGTLWEGISGTIHYLACTISGTSHFLNISDIGPTYALGIAAQHIIAQQVPATLYKVRIGEARFAIGGGGTADITAYACNDCDLDIYGASIVNTINMTAPSKISSFKANVLNIPGSNYASSPVTVDALQCYGDILTNLGASGDVEFDLPAATIGMEIIFFNLAAQTITIDPNGTDQIMVLTGSPGDYLRSDGVIGSYIKLKCLVANQWHKIDIVGTWTEE